MSRFVALSLATLMTAVCAATPAVGEPTPKTELISLEGKSVDSMRLRHDFASTWVIDTQTILYRDDVRDYYLVSLKEACATLGIRSRSFSFQPAWSWKLEADRSYEVRPEAGSRCDIAKIEQIDKTRADPLREASMWRVW
jgi:hypothetical protein